MTTRIEHVLGNLAQQHAPALLNQPLQGDARWRAMANGLARQGVLVLMAEVGAASHPNQDPLVNQWIALYGELYYAFAQALFPSFVGVDAVYADNQLPPMVVITGECVPVIRVLAGYAVPYVARRQGTMPTDAEIRGVLVYMLDELEASDLPRVTYENLVQKGMDVLRRLCQQPLRQITLTDFSRPVFGEEPTQPQPPTTIPDQPKKPGDTGRLFSTDIPVFFDRKPRQKTQRKPPLPDLPDRE